MTSPWPARKSTKTSSGPGGHGLESRRDTRQAGILIDQRLDRHLAKHLSGGLFQDRGKGPGIVVAEFQVQAGILVRPDAHCQAIEGRKPPLAGYLHFPYRRGRCQPALVVVGARFDTVAPGIESKGPGSGGRQGALTGEV